MPSQPATHCAPHCLIAPEPCCFAARAQLTYTHTHTQNHVPVQSSASAQPVTPLPLSPRCPPASRLSLLSPSLLLLLLLLLTSDSPLSVSLSFSFHGYDRHTNPASCPTWSPTVLPLHPRITRGKSEDNDRDFWCFLVEYFGCFVFLPSHFPGFHMVNPK